MPSLLITIIAAIGAVILLVLVAPVRVRVTAGPEGSASEVRYLLFRVRRDLVTGMREVFVGPWMVQHGIPVPERAPRKPKRKRKPGVEKSVAERGRVLMDARPALRRLVRVLARLVGRLLRSVHLESADVHIAMGLGNPARTGMATGIFYAMRPSVIALIPKLRLTMAPDFNASHLAVDSDIRLRVIPMQPVFHVMRALGTLPWRRLWKLKNAWTA